MESREGSWLPLDGRRAHGRAPLRDSVQHPPCLRLWSHRLRMSSVKLAALRTRQTGRQQMRQIKRLQHCQQHCNWQKAVQTLWSPPRAASPAADAQPTVQPTKWKAPSTHIHPNTACRLTAHSSMPRLPDAIPSKPRPALPHATCPAPLDRGRVQPAPLNQSLPACPSPRYHVSRIGPYGHGANSAHQAVVLTQVGAGGGEKRVRGA
jgi:hypothetical protein